MNSDYYISKSDAFDALYVRFSEIKKNTKYRVKTGFDYDVNNSEFVYDYKSAPSRIFPMIIHIGVYNLSHNSYNGFIRTQDFVNCIKDTYHEERHLQQHTEFYRNESVSQDVIDMARIQFVCNAIPEYKRFINFRNPSEVDAELYGFIKTVEYFDTHFLDNNGKPIVDAKDELVKTIQDKRFMGIGWYGDIKSRTYEDAIDSLENNRYYYKYHMFSFMQYDWKSVSKEFMDFVENDKCVNTYMNVETPMDAISVMYEYAVKNCGVSVRHYPCLKQSVKDIKSNNRAISKAKRMAIIDNKFGDLLEKDLRQEQYDDNEFE